MPKKSKVGHNWGGDDFDFMEEVSVKNKASHICVLENMYILLYGKSNYNIVVY